jgi:hypothetical protein
MKISQIPFPACWDSSREDIYMSLCATKNYNFALMVLLQGDQREEKCRRNRIRNSNSRKKSDILKFCKKEKSEGLIVPLRKAVDKNQRLWAKV